MVFFVDQVTIGKKVNMVLELHVLSVDMSRTWAHHPSDHNFCALALGYRGGCPHIPSKRKGATILDLGLY